MSRMEKLSVVIITYNEMRNIERCIKSVADFADEVVVVDSLSNDGTQEIARNLGAKVIEQPFLGHIAQKNYAKSMASNEWVLSLDADEEVSSVLKASILAALQEPLYDGYKMNRLTNYCGQWIKHSGWYPDQKLRLFKRDRGSWQGVNPHDRFDMVEGARVAKLKGDLLHYSFYSVEEHLKQIDKFSTIAAQAKFENGVRTSPLMPFVKGLAKFIKAYVIKLGFLDGYFGWLIAVYSAKASYLKYFKLLQLQKQAK